jgi:biopolymer transport protein ExbD/biopolymer transport protein TolR
MLRTWRRPAQLFSDFNSLQFASVMGLVVFVILLVFMTDTRPHHHLYVDLPKVHDPVSMVGADREDAIKITITRDGRVWLGGDPLYDLADLPGKLRDHLKDPEVEHKAYVTADMRARWGTVKMVLQGVHDAGIVRVAFLANQRGPQ